MNLVDKQPRPWGEMGWDGMHAVGSGVVGGPIHHEMTTAAADILASQITLQAAKLAPTWDRPALYRKLCTMVARRAARRM